jgi:hypothetical protein
MGYDVHITRIDDWTKAESKPIRLEEWIAVVRDDPEMHLDGFAEAETPGGLLRYESKGLAVWTAYSGHQVDGNKAWFDHRRGAVIVKNPDEEILRKMKEIAKKLKAKVIGDEGEEY